MRSGLVYEGLTEENGAISAIVPDVSVVVPIHNEVESLPLLLEAIASTNSPLFISSLPQNYLPE